MKCAKMVKSGCFFIDFRKSRMKFFLSSEFISILNIRYRVIMVAIIWHSILFIVILISSLINQSYNVNAFHQKNIQNFQIIRTTPIIQPIFRHPIWYPKVQVHQIIWSLVYAKSLPFISFEYSKLRNLQISFLERYEGDQ